MSSAVFEKQINTRLETLYGARSAECADKLAIVLAQFEKQSSSRTPCSDESPTQIQSLWDERDVVLITYGDQVQSDHQSGLRSLHQFLKTHGITELINTVHILPFSPSSSDDGFSVIDYRQVASEVGSWQDVRDLGSDVRLMFDLVLNHCSQHSVWFQDFLAGKAPFDRFFITADPSSDLSTVTRPRSLPLLTDFETDTGTKSVWTTFSADQVDLNFAESDVLVEMMSILLFYVEQGARIIRLDAIAYLWKELGTNCIHLPQTHEVVKLMRDVLDEYAPHVILLTETNVPHDENVSYFGVGDEAHMVYQFSLPPLLLDAFLNQDATVLSRWLETISLSGEKSTYFNFTASHDGIGVRPLEGLVPSDRVQRLAQHVLDRRGYVSTKRNANGSDSPYELNTTYLDALGGVDITSQQQVDRFLASQAIMLSLPGIPGVYFHSLVGTPNDYVGAEESGQPRRINRKKYQLQELNDAVSSSDSSSHSSSHSSQKSILDGYKRLLDVRIKQPAFHPNASCTPIDLKNSQVLAFCRESLDELQTITSLVNLGSDSARITVSEITSAANSLHSQQGTMHDLLSGDKFPADETIELQPHQAMWLLTS